MIADKPDRNVVEDLMEPLSNDLIAYYNALKQSIIDIIEENKDKEPDEVIHLINKLLEE